MNLQKQVVHIGCYVEIPGAPLGPKIDEDTKYTCFELEDRFKKDIDDAYRYISEMYKSRVELIFSSVLNNKFKNESVDEVHMYNVLGDPSVNIINELLAESYRILKPQKKLFIGETNTPYCVENLILDARKHRFSMEVIVPHPLEHINEKELNRFYEIMKENTTSEAYNKNFSEWYRIFMRLKLDPTNDYRLNQGERETIEKYKGREECFSNGSYLVSLIKQ